MSCSLTPVRRLELALEAASKDARRAENKLRFLANPETEQQEQEWSEALRAIGLNVELVNCLRRLVKGRTVGELHAAFGAPGDFGYETPIGAALAKVYGL